MAAVDALSTPNTTTPSASGDAFSALTSGDFLKIILTEMSKQDPLQPNDTKSMIEELSGLRQIQSSNDLSTQLKTLVDQNSLASAATLIGKTVSGVSNGSRVTGQVVSITRTDSGATLNLQDGTALPMSQFDQVLQTSAGGAS
jgi:flagellar basal-body rod modification protein FlgD